MKLNLKTPPKIATFLAIAIVALCGGRIAADQEPENQPQALDGGRWRLTEWQAIDNENFGSLNCVSL